MKKAVSFVLSLALVLSLGVFGTFAASSRDDYLAEYDKYVLYYDDTYVPSYNSYNATLDAFSARVDAAKDELTAEQFVRIISFLNEVKAERSAFFGDRETPGTSRYEVPFYRNAMYAAADKEDYDLALEHRNKLLELVTARVTFLGGLADKLGKFDIKGDGGTVPEVPKTVVADFKVTSNESGKGSFTITLTNNTDSDISGWALSFTGSVKSLKFADGSKEKFQSKGTTVTIEPQNKKEASYTIEKGTSIVILGESNDMNFLNFKFNDNPITVNFS